ncbi:unnamed protein product [Durusdinium trenchii]|uniref:Clathrin/coatomer adaptor adaptin-like N-terminal domain-containing protein n=1 Tax=Durusdinium trenchii TaxID=1381693 RepID=A0ABP0IK36_9DINO
MFAHGSMAQTELRRWIKAKIQVSVLDAQAVLEENDWALGPRAALLGYCSAVHVADPDHSSWAVLEEGGISRSCSGRWDPLARDAHLQMAKDVQISGIRAFFLSGTEVKRLEETEALHQLREAHWESAALVPELQVTACYRNMDYGALQAPEHAARAMKASRRLLSITAQCQQGGTDPLTLKLNAESYSYLTGLLANMDSLYFMWSACLVETCKPAGRKPSWQEAESYIRLWKQYLSGLSLVGRPFELARLEEELLWGFCQRLRRLAEEDLAGESSTSAWCKGSGGTLPWCAGPIESRRLEAEPEVPSQKEPPYFEEALRLSPVPGLSPPISAAWVSECLRGQRGEEGTSWEAEPEAEEGEAEDSPQAQGSAREFLLDSVYDIALPTFRVVLDLSHLPGEDVATLEADLPQLEVVYASNLDCRFLTVSSSCAVFQESHFGSQSHSEAFRGAAAVHWEQMHIESTNFGDMKRQVRITSKPKLSIDLRRLWPYARHFPGLRPCDPYVEAIHRWFPGPVPEDLVEALAVVSASRQTTWVLELPLLRVPLGPEGLPILEIVFTNAQLSYSSLYGVRSLAWPEAQVFFHGRQLEQRPIVHVQGLEVQRFGDFERNWAKAVPPGFGRRPRNPPRNPPRNLPASADALTTAPERRPGDTIKEKIATALKVSDRYLPAVVVHLVCTLMLRRAAVEKCLRKRCGTLPDCFRALLMRPFELNFTGGQQKRAWTIQGTPGAGEASAIKKKLLAVFKNKNPDFFSERLQDIQELFQRCDKASVLQESRCFSDAPIDAPKCLNLLTRIIYLIQQGEKFTAQAQCTRLRRMVYLVIKELEPSDQEAGVRGKNDCFRANSIRVLSRVLDPAMAAQIDRYLKTAIVDKNPFVSSSALVCGMTLHATVPDVVKRWVNEIQDVPETVNSEHSMVQFHALALLYELKKGQASLVFVLVGSSALRQARCAQTLWATQNFAFSGAEHMARVGSKLAKGARKFLWPSPTSEQRLIEYAKHKMQYNFGTRDAEVLTKMQMVGMNEFRGVTQMCVPTHMVREKVQEALVTKGVPPTVARSIAIQLQDAHMLNGQFEKFQVEPSGSAHFYRVIARMQSDEGVSDIALAAAGASLRPKRRPPGAAQGYATQTLMSERDAQVEKTLMSYLDSCLRHKSEMVTYEAARAFCQLAAVDTDGASGHTVLGYDMTHATTILQIFLTSPKPVVRFGAIRTLNMLPGGEAGTDPAADSFQAGATRTSRLRGLALAFPERCNCDMEPLLSDQNRNTATLALTTLLKTGPGAPGSEAAKLGDEQRSEQIGAPIGHESNVERLVKQISSFMSDITEVFKVEVVRAVKGLCLLYPGKYKVLMSFLSSNLREDGTAEIKKDLVDALILIISQVPAAREVGLLHLCEFIEDCEYPNLCTRILGFLGEEVPSTSHPAKYIRFIYNRLILENALVRAAAVDALSKIAMKCANLRKDVLILLQCPDASGRCRHGRFRHGAPAVRR